MDRRFLVTGAYGCIGAWVLRELVELGASVTGFDLGANRTRLSLIMTSEQISAVEFIAGDITNAAAVEATIDGCGITDVIHLAALQIPMCRVDPPAGARVNVVGTTNIFEAVTQRLDRMRHVVYASSVAAYAVPERGFPPSMTGVPSTLYGAFKRANEAAAAIYRADTGLSSVGLRPHTVYGVGRDQGVTSAPTSAMLAAAAGVGYTIPFTGTLQFQHARDVARAFVAASLAPVEGAYVFDLPGHTASIDEVVAIIAEHRPRSGETITSSGEGLRLPVVTPSPEYEATVGSIEQIPLASGIADTIDAFADLLARGLVTAPS